MACLSGKIPDWILISVFTRLPGTANSCPNGILCQTVAWAELAQKIKINPIQSGVFSKRQPLNKTVVLLTAM